MKALFTLAKDRRVFIYDQIGGGASSATPAKSWNIKTFVEELETLVNAWGLDRFHIFSGSWGTTLALEYYLRHGKNRVNSLTFQSPMFSTADWERDAKQLIRGLSAEHQKVIRYCHEIGATDSAVYQEALKAYYAKHVCRNRARLKQSFAVKNPNGNKVYAHMWGPSEFSATGTLKNYDKVSALATIACPSLIICGEHDEARPATGRGYAKRIPGAEFREIKGASHAILAEKPAALKKYYASFYRSTIA